MDFASRGIPLEILSATYVENVENYIFVEAFRKSSVFEALKGINIFLSKVEILSLNEMPKIYEENDYNQMKMPNSGHWVRVKSGLYDKDLAIVEKAVSDDQVVLKLIPRLEIVNSYKRSSGQKKKFNTFSRPPQKEFIPSMHSGELTTTRAFGLNKFFH